MATVRNFFRALFELNFDQLLGAVSWRLPNWLFVFTRSIIVRADNPKLLTRQLTTYVQKFITIEDAPLLEKVNIPKKLLADRLRHGDRCYVVCRDDEILTIIWGSTGKRYMKFYGTILDPGDAGLMFYGGFTAESMRLRGLFPVAFETMYQSFLKENRSVVYAAINSLNKQSIKLHRRMNFSEVGEAIHWSLFGIKFTYYRSWPHKTKKLRIFVKAPPNGLFWN